MKQRDISVELLRCIACLIVIGTHVCLPSVIGNSVDPSRLLISCALADGAAIFWFITGFFIFSSSWTRLLKKTAITIGLPLVLFTIFMFLFEDSLLYGTPLGESVSHTSEEYKQALLSLIALRNPIGSMIHTWFLYSYLLFALMYPLFSSFVHWLDESRKRTNAFLLSSLLFFLWNDIAHNQLACFSATSINSVFPAAIEMIWGHILYKNRFLVFNKNDARVLTLRRVAPVLLFLLLNLIRCSIQYYRYQNDPLDSSLLYWYSSFGLICSGCIAITILNLKTFQPDSIPHFAMNTIRWVGAQTFLIYIVHYPLLTMLNRLGLQQAVFDTIQSAGITAGIATDVCYTLGMSAVCFIISLVLSTGFSELIKLLAVVPQRLSPAIDNHKNS
ncbi:MAG: acyltransferase [Collinsella sp.]|nr:acyltransferase [Collinsella sp.]